MKEYIHGGDIYRHPDVLDYSANINPLGTPPGVIRAAKDSMERVCHYPDACQEKLKQALAEYEQVPVEWLICGNGAAELIFALVQAVKPKRALVLAPTFAEYAQALEAVGPGTGICERCCLSYSAHLFNAIEFELLKLNEL